MTRTPLETTSDPAPASAGFELVARQPKPIEARQSDETQETRTLTLLVIGTLCLCLVVCTLGIVTMVSVMFLQEASAPAGAVRSQGIEIPNALVALVSGLLGALTGFLASPSFRSR